MRRNIPSDDRARKTLYVTGFNPKLTTKHLLKELFMQGGPVRDVTLFDTHAYVLFEDEESVPYCLALFNEIEVHGQKLRLNPRSKTKDAFCYLKYLTTVRKKLMDEYMKIPPPELPPKERRKIEPRPKKRAKQQQQQHQQQCLTKRQPVKHRTRKTRSRK